MVQQPISPGNAQNSLRFSQIVNPAYRHSSPFESHYFVYSHTVLITGVTNTSYFSDTHLFRYSVLVMLFIEHNLFSLPLCISSISRKRWTIIKNCLTLFFCWKLPSRASFYYIFVCLNLSLSIYTCTNALHQNCDIHIMKILIKSIRMSVKDVY